MIFRRIIFQALFVGLIAGLLMSLAQSISTTPIIIQAEAFEQEPDMSLVPAEMQVEHSHTHDDEAWAPEDGGERTFYTVLSNVLAGIGFAAMMLAVMSQMQSAGLTRLSLVKGLLWGVAGYIAFFLVPAIGLPPEIPGVEAAAVENRQLWWVMAVLASLIGLGVLAFAPVKFKALGVLALALPFVFKAPHPAGPLFAHPDPAVVSSLTQLHQQFVFAAGATNLVFWLALGVLSAWALNRFVLNGDQEAAH